MTQQTINRLTFKLVFFWSILAGYFAFTDLQVSIWLADTSSGWARFLEDFGEIPGLLVLYSGTFILLLYYLSSTHKFKLIFLPLLFLSATFLSSYFAVILYRGVTGNHSGLQENIFYIGGIFLILNLIAAYRFRNIKIRKRILEYAEKSVLLGFVGYILIIQPIKHIWGRIRFRDLDLLYNNFTPWFLPNGITGHQSFPSGHSAMAWMILPILVLVSQKSKIIKKLSLFIVVFWGLAVPISRIVIGAHYASDALFGACIVCVTYLVIKNNYQFIH